MTDTVVPEGTSTIEHKILIGAVVRLSRAVLNHSEGTHALVVSTDERLINDLELIVPGYPIKFWVPSEHVTVLMPPRDDWWALLLGEPADDDA